MKMDSPVQAGSFKERAPLGYLVHEVAKLMKRRFEVEARAHGITLPQWRALAQIALRNTVTQVALAQAMDADPMTLSGVLDRLEKRGLIERYTDPSDNRAKLTRLTEAGATIYKTAREVGTNMYQSSLDGISAADAAVAEGVLARMRDNLIGQDAELEDN